MSGRPPRTARPSGGISARPLAGRPDGRMGPKARSCYRTLSPSQLPTGGSPLQSRNLAARAARWSAQHRKTAIFGWLAFVVVAFVIGGAIGTKQLDDEDTGNGSSQVADRRSTTADFPDKADEQVLVQGRGSVKVGDPAFTAAVNDVVAAPQAAPHVRDVESPLATGNEGQISKDGRSALVTFEIAGDDDQREGPRRRRAGGDGRRPAGQSRAAHRAVRRRQRRQGARRSPSRTTSRRPSSSRCRSRC